MPTKATQAATDARSLWVIAAQSAASTHRAGWARESRRRAGCHPRASPPSGARHLDSASNHGSRRSDADAPPAATTPRCCRERRRSRGRAACRARDPPSPVSAVMAADVEQRRADDVNATLVTQLREQDKIARRVWHHRAERRRPGGRSPTRSVRDRLCGNPAYFGFEPVGGSSPPLALPSSWSSVASTRTGARRGRACRVPSPPPSRDRFSGRGRRAHGR